MKFQFMSMSLSYFSSLNMLKSLRDMNAGIHSYIHAYYIYTSKIRYSIIDINCLDTTSAAIAMSADAAAAAAGAGYPTYIHTYIHN